MAREITGMRDYIESLNRSFPNKEILTKTDICKYLGICRNTLKKRFPQLWISSCNSKTELAKLLAKM